jgi:hypothetical protein
VNLQICKILSSNDLGRTGSHQAGIHVPKDGHILRFFPVLDQAAHNPRTPFVVLEESTGISWTFQFIYYNNRRVGGTRDEYRLTHMTKFLRQSGAVQGDQLILTRKLDESVTIQIRSVYQTRGEQPPEGRVMGNQSVVRDTPVGSGCVAIDERREDSEVGTIKIIEKANDNNKQEDNDILVLTGGWKIISIGRNR